MRESRSALGRKCYIALMVLAALAMAVRGTCAASRPDSSTLDWALLYAGRIDLTRDDEIFPWNDPEAVSHRNDRLVSMLGLRPVPALAIFLKGASGYRREQENVYRNRFALAQGHAHFDFLGGDVRGRLFLRERSYRTHHKLLRLVSNDAPFLDGRGQGVHLDAGNAARRFHVRYIESILRSEDLAIHGGLPLLAGGGDIFRMLSCSVLPIRGTALGFTASEIRSLQAGDGVMIGSDIDLTVHGVRFIAELARTVRGRWDDLMSASLFDLDPRKARIRSLSGIFSRNVAFSSEVHGLEVRSARLGIFSIVPGYRYYGRGFFDPQGEITGGLIESSLTSWWRHVRYNAGVSVEVCERYDGTAGERYELVRCISRAALQGGFALVGNALFAEGRRSSVLLSILDEHDQARILTTVRLDDAGRGNDLSFLAEGQMNLSSFWSLRNTLYLYRSSASYYTAELEFRPSRRFLLRAAIGTFRPFEEDINMNRALDPPPPSGERWLSIYTRVWFGTI